VTKVDFYIVKESAADAWLRYACRLVEKAYDMGLRVHIQTTDENMTNKMDELLWVFKQDSFIPHQASTNENEICAVTLNHSELPKHREVLVNLTASIPEYYTEFERVAEIVGNDPSKIKAARERFRLYKEKGEEPKHHEIN
jgi:DNA polymerase-3 subunit chi